MQPNQMCTLVSLPALVRQAFQMEQAHIYTLHMLAKYISVFASEKTGSFFFSFFFYVWLQYIHQLSAHPFVCLCLCLCVCVCVCEREQESANYRQRPGQKVQLAPTPKEQQAEEEDGEKP
ncbi:hypothetical protein COCON_G00107750 [Conger conger]|uniref:Uncharacterized protein n=1 Tax=Conger conger TaxID=82655 RepID=A0A9Q1HY20_CONCO|nr:hypothetical protein COCON_G00107750 [Conger conger]